MGSRVKEIEIEFRIFCSNIMLNYQMSQNLKLLRYGKFNHLINTSNKEIALSGFKILTLNAMKEKGKLN